MLSSLRMGWLVELGSSTLVFSRLDLGLLVDGEETVSLVEWRDLQEGSSKRTLLELLPLAEWRD